MGGLSNWEGLDCFTDKRTFGNPKYCENNIKSVGINRTEDLHFCYLHTPVTVVEIRPVSKLAFQYFNIKSPIKEIG